MKLNNIKVFMERNFFLRKIALLLKHCGLVKLLHRIGDVFSKAGSIESEKFMQFYTLHKGEFDKVIGFLSDDFSRKTYQALLDCHLGNNRHELSKYVCFPQYFPANIPGLSALKDSCIFIDGGAYVGDTIEEFVKFTQSKYKKIYAWEPDEKNICKLKKTIRRYFNVEIIKKGLWSCDDTLHFSDEGTDKSAIQSTGSVKIEVSSIDNIHRNENISLIKMDIEGAEMEALKGSYETISRCKPILAICIYHSYEDLYQIPLWIKENFPDYNIYIRAHSDLGGEVVMYAIS